jgi:serralysin
MFLSPSANGDPNFFAKGPGSPGYGTMIHEIGHAMGLKHPYEYRNTTEDAEIEEIPDGIFLPPELDHRHNTVMSYNGRDFQGRQNAQTLMNYDIQALQYLYGVNRNFRSGNDVYQWDGNSFLAVEAIWDGGGVDTLEMVSLPETDSYLFDLNPGGLLTTQTGRQGRFFGEYPSNEPLYPMFDRGKSIAPGAILENIYSTSGSDEVIGNGVNNLILTRRGNDNARGGPGDDTVWGGRDNDLLNGDDGIDQLNGNIGADTVIGGNGNDQLNGGRDDDQLLGEAGDDLLSGDLGNDTLTGGAGADRFVLGSGAGQDSILDFATGIDRVQLNGVGREAIALVPQGGATLVQIAGSGEILAAVNGVIALSDFL